MSPESKTGILAFGITIGGFVVVAAVVLAMSDASGAMGVGLLCLFVVLTPIALFLGLAALISYVARNAQTPCPECGERGTMVFVKKTVIEQKKCYGLVTRYSSTISTGDITGPDHGPAGQIVTAGSTEWQERVPVIRTTYLLYFQCRECQALQTEENVVEVEDFEIERE